MENGWIARPETLSADGQVTVQGVLRRHRRKPAYWETAMSEDSVLVSLQELRNIETRRRDRERAEMEEKRQRAEAERQRAARRIQEQKEARVRVEQEQAHREQERRRCEEREEKLRLAEAERRARVEAELALERQKLTLQTTDEPCRQGKKPLIRFVVLVCATGMVIGLAYLARALLAQTAHSQHLENRLSELTSRSSSAERAARQRVALLSRQVNRLQSLLEHSLRPAPPTGGEQRPRHNRTKPKTKNRSHPPSPLVGTRCKGSDDPICGLTDGSHD